MWGTLVSERSFLVHALVTTGWLAQSFDNFTGTEKKTFGNHRHADRFAFFGLTGFQSTWTRSKILTTQSRLESRLLTYQRNLVVCFTDRPDIGGAQSVFFFPFIPNPLSQGNNPWNRIIVQRETVAGYNLSTYQPRYHALPMSNREREQS